MSNYAAIKNELVLNPTLYNSMDDQAVADELNAIDKEINRTSMTRQEVVSQFDPGEFDALNADGIAKLNIVLADTVNPFDAMVVHVITSLFGAGATLAALNAARVELVSRASQIGAGKVRVAHVTNARAI